MAKNFKTYEEALEAQGTAKEAVKESKSALTDYYTKNKLKRNEDYTDDAKHGAKVGKLQAAIDKASEHLSDVNEQLKSLKPKKEKAGREMKYEYPAECDTAEKRKKYRIEQRRKASGSDKPKKEAKSKADKAANKEPEKTESKVTSKKKVKPSASAKEETPAKVSKKSKIKAKAKRRSSDD